MTNAITSDQHPPIAETLEERVSTLTATTEADQGRGAQDAGRNRPSTRRGPISSSRKRVGASRVAIQMARNSS